MLIIILSITLKWKKKNKIFRSLVNVQINYHISVGKADIWAFCYFFTTLLKMVLKNIEWYEKWV